MNPLIIIAVLLVGCIVGPSLAIGGIPVSIHLEPFWIITALTIAAGAMLISIIFSVPCLLFNNSID